MSIKKRIFSLMLAFAIILTIAPWPGLDVRASYTGSFQFNADGKFTVMQIADTQDNENTYQRVINVIANAVGRYQPDLVVFTGDNVIESILSESKFQTAVRKIMNPLINTNTKFAVTFGNHDDEGPGAPNKTTQYNYFKSYGGNCFVDHDVYALDGVGSGVIPIYQNGQTSGKPAYQLYLMDSGSDPSTGKYDACYTNQIDYYIQRSQTYPNVPSLWFQHVIVPDIYSECMTKTNNGTGVSFDGWYLRPERINWARCSSNVLSDIYNEAPASASWSLYQSTAHRSSPTYGSKTLYESWKAYGNLKGAYFGHDHLNEFTCTTAQGIDLGYGEGTTLYKAGYVWNYNDDDPGVSIYELDINGSYTNEYVTEQDLTIPVYDPASPLGSWRFYAKTFSNLSSGQYNCGTDEDVFIRLYSGSNGTGTLLYQSPDLVGTESGGNSGFLSRSNIPTTNAIKSIQIILPVGNDDWICDQVCVYYTPFGGSEQLIWNYDPHYTAFDEGDFVNFNTSWFQTNSHAITYDGNGATGGTMASQSLVWGTSKGFLINAFTKKGYTFQGWATSPSGSFEYPNGANITMGTRNISLYAIWSPATYTIEYNGNGSTAGSTAGSVHTYNEAKALTLNGFTRTGHTFSGWSTSAGGVVVYSDGQSILNIEAGGMSILYAVWIPKIYNVYFDANGGTGWTFDFMAYGSSLTPPVVVRTGYTFSGWLPSVPKTVGEGDASYVARWTPYYILGDVNQDGSVNVADALKTMQAVAGSTVLSEAQILAADVDRSNTISISDALKILQYVSGNISSF